MGWLADRMVDWLIVREAVSEEDRELYEYAVECSLMTIVPLLLAILVGGIMRELSTGVILILPFMALRTFSGGYHAKHMETCLFCSSGLLVICILIAAQLTYSWQLCVSMLLGAVWLFLFSPVDSENRRLDHEEKRRYRYTAGILAIAVCVISVLLKKCGAERFAVCMAMGLFLTVTLQMPCVLQRVFKKVASVFIVAVFVAFICTHITAYAQEEETVPVNEIIVVLDCSKSMEDADPQYVSFDFLKSISAVLPRDYRIGVVAYRDEVCTSQPLGSSHAMIESALAEVEYTNYGNAGAGLSAAVELFDDAAISKRIILISDGEIMMKTEEGTQESAELFAQAIEDAKRNEIVVDVIALGQRLEEGHTVYSAAVATGGQLYELADGEELGDFAEELIFEQWKLKASHVGQINGLSGELSVRLPDYLMSRAKIILLGSQQNENMTLNCEAEKINLSKGRNYAVIELLHPSTDEVKIQMSADAPMDVSAYLTAEYDYDLSADYTYVQEEQTADIRLKIATQNGQDMLEGHLREGGVQIYLDDEPQTYRIADGCFHITGRYEHDAALNLRVAFDGLYGNYYGVNTVQETIVVPEIEVEEEPQETIDWFFWSVILIFVIALVIIFFTAGKRRAEGRKKVISENRMLPKETGMHGNDFCGKLVVYVVHNHEGIDYPSESINLFARCNREVITLEWILDVCNLPLQLKGADKIIMKPGDDRSIIIKNTGKASALKNREFLIKGHSYHWYYQEKITFIFDEDDTEIEIHYKDLKPSER